MKKSLKRILYITPTIYAIILLGFVIFAACSSPEPKMGTYTETPIKKEVTQPDSKSCIIFKGNHKIYPVKDNKYFYVYHATDYSTPLCSFLWETNDGFISCSYIKYSDIRFEIDNTIKEPYIKFNWDIDNSKMELQNYIYHDVNYMVVVTNNTNFDEFFSYSNQINSQIVREDD
jgi:hypothetical protein